MTGYRKAIFIASQVRSGSTFAAELIAYHFDKLFGFKLYDLTKEHFSSLDDRSESGDLQKVIDALYLDSSGYVCAKVMTESLSVISKIANSEPSIAEQFFGKNAYWVLIRRRDRIRQAISLAYAEKNNVFHSYVGDSDTKAPLIPTCVEINDALRKILNSDVYLDALSTRFGGQYVEFYYEDIINNVPGYLTCVAKLCDFDASRIGVVTADIAKIKVDFSREKRISYTEFLNWFLCNNHYVA